MKRGKLLYRGGLRLASPDEDFGGLSALLVSSDGSRFVAASDEAHWVTGELQYDSNGNLDGATGAIIGPYLDFEGQPLIGKGGDSEGLAELSGSGDLDGDIAVSFEGNHRIWRYPFGSDGESSHPTNMPLPEVARRAPSNLGLEGITRVDDGWLLAVDENFPNEAGNYHAWLLPFAPSEPSPSDPPGGLLPPGSERRIIEVAVLPYPPFAMTDVRQLAGGDLLTLERRFDATHGTGVQLRRIPWDSVQRAAVARNPEPLDGEIVAAFDQNDEIDNMEGLSVRLGPKGEQLVYLLSDNNFNGPMQRTLLWMFELLP